MSNIHLVMQGKGGVGKSLLAFYLAQYIREKSGKCLVFDTDPLNQTLARTTTLEARVVRILADDHITIMKNAFDLMIEECETEEADVVIDVGASSFVPMLECGKQKTYPGDHRHAAAEGHGDVRDEVFQRNDGVWRDV
jgi:cellulose biosynthesis protein BcsQ